MLLAGSTLGALRKEVSHDLTIIRRRLSEYSRIIPEAIIRQYSLSQSRIAQVIIRENAFSFILLVSSSETSRNRVAAILKVSASVL